MRPPVCLTEQIEKCFIRTNRESAGGRLAGEVVLFSRRAASLAIAALAASAALPANAQQPEIRISRTTTMAYLPLMVAEHEKLIEKHAAALGVPNLKVSWVLFTGPSAQIDALFSGNVDVVAV